MLTLLKHAYSTRLKSSKHAKMSASYSVTQIKTQLHEIMNISSFVNPTPLIRRSEDFPAWKGMAEVPMYQSMSDQGPML
jgi:hypothetical protein